MAEVATTTGRRYAAGIGAPAKPPSAFWRKVRWQALNVFAGAVLLYLFLPITVIILFSFNDPAGRFNLTWNKFSLDAWKHPFGVPGPAATRSSSRSGSRWSRPRWRRCSAR